jgi:hypothetical protein
LKLWVPQSQDQHDLVAHWVATKLRDVSDFGIEPKCIAISDGEFVVAAAVYHDYRDTDIQISFAADTARWATKSNIAAILRYPFASGCRRVTAICHPKNRRVRKLLTGLGFVHEGTLRDAFPTSHALLYGLTKKDFERGKYSTY